MPHQLSRADARRICVRAQLLDEPRPVDLLDTVRHLTLVQHEPTAAVAPTADLVAWSRLGSAYSPTELRDALDEQRLIDDRGLLRPSEDMVLFRAEMAAWPGVGELRPSQVELRAWVQANDACRRDLLDRLRADGPLPLRDLPDSTRVRWPSSGWNNNKNVPMLLRLMVQRGEVAAAGGMGRDRLWDLAERVYPEADDGAVPDLEEALRIRDRRRLTALGLARATATEVPGDANHVGAASEDAVIEGVRGRWRVDPAQLDRVGEPFAGRAALLSPFDRLGFDRKRALDIFGFDYQLEMYKPVAKRRWGYYALPILYADRLVGKLDAAADRAAGVLRVHAIHQDEPFGRATAAAVHDEIDDLALWLGLEVELAS